jgi:hypothetical protein
MRNIKPQTLDLYIYLAATKNWTSLEIASNGQSLTFYQIKNEILAKRLKKFGLFF